MFTSTRFNTRRMLPMLLGFTVFLLMLIIACGPSSTIQASVSDSSFRNNELAQAGVNPPDTPVVNYPMTGAVSSSSTIAFSWNSAGDSLRYEIRYALNPEFNDATLLSVGMTSAEISLGVLVSTLYYWQIRSIAPDSTTSVWTTARTFTLNPQVQVQQWRCNGDCSHCPNPCGRRPNPNPKPIE